MTAPSKNIVAITDTQIASGKPLDTVLMTSIRDALVNLEEQLSFGFTPAQAHNHDGANSASIPVGPNSLRNGSFESGFSGWLFIGYSGGSMVVQSTGAMDGAACLAITSTNATNGGGYAQTTEFESCAAGRMYSIRGLLSASAVNISSKIEIVWFNSAQAQISLSTVYSTTATPTTAVDIGAEVTAPTNARYKQLRITGGVPASGSGTGTVYFDGLIAIKSVTGLQKITTITASGSFTPELTTDRMIVLCIGGGGGGGGGSYLGGSGGGGGGAGQCVYKTFTTIPASSSVTIGAGGTGSANQAVGINGGAGGSTSFDTMSAYGGTGGTAGAAGGGAVGVGGITRIGNLAGTGYSGGGNGAYASIKTGGDGGQGANVTAGGGGGAGGLPNFCTGDTATAGNGTNGVSSVNSVAANSPANSGIGGGGGGGFVANVATAGGAGAGGSGVVYVWEYS